LFPLPAEPDPVNLEQEMGNSDVDVTEEAMEKSNEFKSEAVHLFGDGKYEECIQKYTEAIKLNSGSALLFGKRGQAFLKLVRCRICASYNCVIVALRLLSY
jgi:suppressor of tumorigenicity protein 13